MDGSDGLPKKSRGELLGVAERAAAGAGEPPGRLHRGQAGERAREGAGLAAGGAES